VGGEAAEGEGGGGEEGDEGSEEQEEGSEVRGDPEDHDPEVLRGGGVRRVEVGFRASAKRTSSSPTQTTSSSATKQPRPCGQSPAAPAAAKYGSPGSGANMTCEATRAAYFEAEISCGEPGVRE
jgi:hypothetical protein